MRPRFLRATDDASIESWSQRPQSHTRNTTNETASGDGATAGLIDIDFAFPVRPAETSQCHPRPVSESFRTK